MTLWSEVRLFVKFLLGELQAVPGVAAEMQTVCEVLQQIGGLLPDITSDLVMYPVISGAMSFLTGTEQEACAPQLLSYVSLREFFVVAWVAYDVC